MWQQVLSWLWAAYVVGKVFVYTTIRLLAVVIAGVVTGMATAIGGHFIPCLSNCSLSVPGENDKLDFIYMCIYIFYILYMYSLTVL